MGDGSDACGAGDDAKVVDDAFDVAAGEPASSTAEVLDDATLGVELLGEEATGEPEGCATVCWGDASGSSAASSSVAGGRLAVAVEDSNASVGATPSPSPSVAAGVAPVDACSRTMGSGECPAGCLLGVLVRLAATDGSIVA
jgi:hypothetical protein